jgi:hypothetical protein
MLLLPHWARHCSKRARNVAHEAGIFSGSLSRRIGFDMCSRVWARLFLALGNFGDGISGEALFGRTMRVAVSATRAGCNSARRLQLLGRRVYYSNYPALFCLFFSQGQRGSADVQLPNAEIASNQAQFLSSCRITTRKRSLDWSLRLRLSSGICW